MEESMFDIIKEKVLIRLEALSPDLTYHNLQHTLDVLEQSQRIAIAEGIQDTRQILLLKIAALYHDTGFSRTYAKHEAVGCAIFLEDTVDFDFSEEDKSVVMGLIMATQIPQSPKNLLERIICDADLDYLGRPDFFEIGEGLRKEFLTYGIIANNEEWDNLQIKFLKAHSYHTESSRKLREPAKQHNFTQLA
jgi:uncharacterized protein